MLIYVLHVTWLSLLVWLLRKIFYRQYISRFSTLTSAHSMPSVRLLLSASLMQPQLPSLSWLILPSSCPLPRSSTINSICVTFQRLYRTLCRPMLPTIEAEILILPDYGFTSACAFSMIDLSSMRIVKHSWISSKMVWRNSTSTKRNSSLRTLLYTHHLSLLQRDMKNHTFQSRVWNT